jgi:hypothetical protein
MHASRSRLSVSAIVAGFALALTALPALAGPPTINREVAGSMVRAAAQPPAALAVTVRTCALGYDPAAADADPVRDCRQPAGDTSFRLSQGNVAGPSASTGTSGDSPQESTVRFTNLAPGRYTVTATAPAEIGGAFVAACTSNLRAFVSPFVPLATADAHGAVTLELQAGETLACDWYQVEAAPKEG